MIRPVTLGKAFLAGVLPFAAGCAGGCDGKKPVEINHVEQEEKEYKATHLSELVRLDRNPETKKLFLKLDHNKKKVSEGLKSLGVSEMDRVQFYLWVLQFNKTAKNLEQKEIVINDLPVPVRLIENIDVNDKNSLKKNGVMDPNINCYVYPFLDPFTSLLPQDISPEKEYLVVPISNDVESRHLLPVSISLKNNFKFIPGSLILRDYVDSANPDKKEIKSGLFFQVKEKGEKGRTLNALIPLSNMPLTIDAGDRMYIFAFEEIPGFNENEKKFYLPR